VQPDFNLASNRTRTHRQAFCPSHLERIVSGNPHLERIVGGNPHLERNVSGIPHLERIVRGNPHLERNPSGIPHREINVELQSEDEPAFSIRS